MQRRYLYASAGLAVIAAAGLIDDRTTQLRKDVLPDHINDVNPIQKIGNEGLWDKRHQDSMKLFNLLNSSFR